MNRIVAAVLLAGLALPSLARAEDPVQLRYKFAKGDKHVYSNIQHIESTKGAPNHTEQVIAEETLDVTPTGGRINRTITTLKLAMDNPMFGGRVEFDSEKAEDKAKAAQNPVLLMATLLLDKSVAVQLSGRGEVEKMEGVDKALAALGPMGMVAKPTLEQAIKQTYFELPEKPVKPGDTWTQTTKISNPQFGSITQNYEYTYSGQETRGGVACAKILVKVSTGVKRAKKEPAEPKDDLTTDGPGDAKKGDGKTTPDPKEEAPEAPPIQGTGTIYFAMDGYLLDSEVVTPQNDGQATVKVALVKG